MGGVKYLCGRAYIGGTFDIVHPGHLHLFSWAKNKYGELVVSLNRDDFVRRYKGKKPLMTYEERATVLRALRVVDYVIPNIGDENSRPAIRLAKPNAIVAGSDWTRERLMKQMELTDEFLQEHMIDITIFKDSLPIHSSDIKNGVRAV